MIALLALLDAAAPIAAVEAAPPSPFAFTVAPGVAWGYVTGDNLAPGATATMQIDVGYRTDDHTSVLAHVQFGHLAGTTRTDLGMTIGYDYVPIFIGAGARAEALGGWLWGEIVLGLNVDSLALGGDREGNAALGVAVNAGGDLYHHGADRVGLYVGVQSEIGGDSYEALTLGVAYRR